MGQDLEICIGLYLSTQISLFNYFLLLAIPDDNLETRLQNISHSMVLHTWLQWDVKRSRISVEIRTREIVVTSSEASKQSILNWQNASHDFELLLIVELKAHSRHNYNSNADCLIVETERLPLDCYRDSSQYSQLQFKCRLPHRGNEAPLKLQLGEGLNLN